MKAFVIVTAAKQIDGDFILHRVEKAFRTATRADEYLRGKAREFRETVTTDFGPVQCDCERAAFEVEVED